MAVTAINSGFTVWSNNSVNSWRLSNSIKRLTTGMILPTDDPAGLGISERMRAQISAIDMARRNTVNQISMHQTSSGFSQSITTNLSRMKELAIQAQGVTNPEDRELLEEEFKMLQDDTAKITSKDTALGQFNGMKLFQGESTTVQVGPDAGQKIELDTSDLQITSEIAAGNRTFGSVIDSINGLQLTDADALEALDAAMDTNISSMAKNASHERVAQLRLEGLLAQEDNMRASESKIRDIDFARESVNFTQLLVQKQVNNALMAQGNALSSFGILNLL